MASTRTFLFELGVEEMPSAPLNNAVKQIEALMVKGLDESGLAHGAVRVLSSPRRLAALVQDVTESTEEIHSVMRGPSAKIAFDADGNPTKAAEGFARRYGLTAADLVLREDADGAEYVFAEQNVPSEPALPILTRVCEELIGAIQWPNYRSQRWGSEHESFVRPVRWICSLFGDEVVPVSFAGVVSGNVTRGHRVLSPGEHIVLDADGYEALLESVHVLSAERRAQVIRDGIARVEAGLGVRVDTPAKIFDEVVNLCEWPTVLVGNFDEEFLAVPSEIICESMLSNQRYFPTYGTDGKLTRAFVVVSNADPAVSETVIDGNERVVRARLMTPSSSTTRTSRSTWRSSASASLPLASSRSSGRCSRNPTAWRISALAIAREAHVGASSASDAQRAAHLAKADLVSSAVVEFTNQQGVMGGYYAAAAGEAPEVAAAIRDHYRPRFAGDELPEGVAGCIVAVADKLDTIAGMFAIGEPPTGSKDPFALRRSAIGVLNILRDRLGCGYELLVRAALDAYAEQGLEFDRDIVAESVCAFIKGRMEQMARDEKVPSDVVAAVSAGSVTIPADYLALARALDGARTHDRASFENLATAYARASHLADATLGTSVDRTLMGAAESALLEAVDKAEGAVASSLNAKDFSGVIEALASLREPIDAFFDDVMVMDEDVSLRENRLRLLNRFESVFAGIADIGELAKKK